MSGRSGMVVSGIFAMIGLCGIAGGRGIELEQGLRSVGRFEKLQMSIEVNGEYEDPWGDEVEVDVVFSGPSGEEWVVPAFFGQLFERRDMQGGCGRRLWLYPKDAGGWKVRFAPMKVGRYRARAVLRDKMGKIESAPVEFECVESDSRGFLRVGREDSRFFELDDGSFFFAIGQNIAFVGDGQYVGLSKAEEIFGRLRANGANFVRVWTCCKDWAMAIEARKSAWGRSWGGKTPVVAMPGSAEGRMCVKLGGDGPASVAVQPSHAVGLRPKTEYVLEGRFRAEGAEGLRVVLNSFGGSREYEAGGGWRRFERRFSTGEDALWLGRLSLEVAGGGTVWLDGLSLKEAGGGPELLWEADVNRPVRGYFNQVDCFMLDELVEAAEENGVYLMLCAITRDLYMSDLSKPGSSDYEQATADAKRFMRYAVARWGYSTSVGAWEYFNEMDPGKPTDKFYDEVGRYLEQIDAYGHLRTTSTWHPSARDCEHGRIDIAQLHHYMRLGTKEDYRDEVAVIVEKAEFLREHAPDKPALIGEFGLADAKWGLADSMKKDARGVHFHSCLWASAFSGASGTAMFWWWEVLDAQDAYRHYLPLSRYMDGVSFSGLREVQAESSREDLRVLGCQGDDRAYIWFSNGGANWYDAVIEGADARPVAGASVAIAGLNRGTYEIEWWDTWSGRIVRRETVGCDGSTLKIAVRKFARDTACKVRKQ